MTIAHVVFRCIPGDYRGGVERVALELASEQARIGHDVEIMAVREGEEQDCTTPTGVRLRYFPATRIAGVLSSPQLAKALRAQAGRLRVIHAHNSFHPLNIEARRAARDCSAALFYHTHGALDPKLLAGKDFRALKKKLYIRLFERSNLNHANAVFALSNEERGQLRSIGVVAPIEVVPNGIVPPRVGGNAERIVLRQRLGIPPEAPVILFLGRIVSKKAIEDIIGAHAIVQRRHPDAALLLVGNPDEEPAYGAMLRAMVEREGLARCVHWLGFADESNKAESLAAADLFVHASYSEGLAMAVLEGMSAVLATVVTKGCYMDEAAREGALVQTDQGPQALAEGLLSLIDNPAELSRVAQAGRDYVARHHSWSVLARKVLDAYGRHSALTQFAEASPEVTE